MPIRCEVCGKEISFEDAINATKFNYVCSEECKKEFQEFMKGQQEKARKLKEAGNQ